METLSLVLLLTLILIGILASLETLRPGMVTEGFMSLPRTSYWSTYISPHANVGPDNEDSAFIRDPRYFNDYTDVSRLGLTYDFCRVVESKDDPEDKFFACALAGTDFQSSTKFRTKSVKDGFKLSLDDYMNDIDKDGRADYCRIIKWKDGTFQPVCNRATDIGFDDKEVIDPDPPEEISLLLRFYDSCVMWLRFDTTMLDFIKTTNLQITGGVAVDEQKKKTEPVEGVELNGYDQFIRLSDSLDLTLGSKLPIRSIRAWMVWVYFDEFTNNAKIFDFGNGPGKDNVFLGIERKGDSFTDTSEIRPLLCGGDSPRGAQHLGRSQGASSLYDSTLPTEPSGAQPVPEVDPKKLMETSNGNVDDFICQGFEISPRRLPGSFPGKLPAPKDTKKATLVYEVWDKQGRKLRLKVPGAFPLKRWTHVCITATSDDGFRPNIAVFLNGKQVIEKESGWLPQTSSMSNCYIGKSNWMNSVELYENRDELFKGRIFDFRAYRRSQSSGMINESYDWGKKKLDIRNG